ncbi:hypothetical protein DFA_10915 [Cavenderia fasciculata]|uniref:PPM-type phosphatase domain-containing protein n=1 Tax=Cavenderia fasciculata TaxID=261658 RepID=F4QBR9_CACFS|nr:uncharacterized protein DFA_10915 [Cavenderia fasciculata]EGG14657.1 hypothetical protein DFA_10915 [Cavenderia fasciculata]|eukprot:XP_004351165.1 hypothetical protein DFA_10915 [Cavenderia fasciculata]
MGAALDKVKEGEPSNQDAFVFWHSLKKIYGDTDSLPSYFHAFMVDNPNAGEDDDLHIGNGDDEDEGGGVDGGSAGTANDSNNSGGSSSSTSSSNNTSGNGSPTNKSESYLLVGQTKEGSRNPSPSSQSKISFVGEFNPNVEEMNKTLLQTINCKLQLIPPELNHFTLNLDNHCLTEKLFLSICAAIIVNNENYSNRHMSTTLRDTPLTTIRKKKIQQEYLDFIAQYYFTITKLSLKKTMLSSRSLEALSQALRNNRSITELDLGGNELHATGLAVLTAGLRSNKSVTRINLSDVKAYDEGAFMIAAFLMSTKTIKTLDLSTNHISEKGLEALKQSVIRNTSITSLYLEDNNVDQSKLYSLNHILKRNSCVQFALETIFERIPWNRKFKNKIQSFKKGVMQTRTNSTLNISVDEERTPLFRLMNKQNSSASIQEKIPPPPELESSRYVVGKSETIGKRPTMEDRMVAYGCYQDNSKSELYCVFDGHGGRAASDFAAENIYRIFGEYLDSKKIPEEAFKCAFQNIHVQIAPWPFIGTTAACAYIKEDQMCVANVGDSRVVLGYWSNESSSFQASRLSFDHRPVEDSERNRITQAGGTVLNGRVNGMLAVSRALGDSFLTPYVTANPHIHNMTIAPEHKFLIIACDGVWDIVSDEDAVDLVSAISDPNRASETLRDFAYQLGSTDNISVMVVKLCDY